MEQVLVILKGSNSQMNEKGTSKTEDVQQHSSDLVMGAVWMEQHREQGSHGIFHLYPIHIWAHCKVLHRDKPFFLNKEEAWTGKSDKFHLQSTAFVTSEADHNNQHKTQTVSPQETVRHQKINVQSSICWHGKILRTCSTKRRCESRNTPVQLCRVSPHCLRKISYSPQPTADELFSRIHPERKF